MKRGVLMKQEQKVMPRIHALSPRAIEKWGISAQVIKALEELSELQVQLCKVLNGSPTTEAAVIDDIADVVIVAHQLRKYFGEIEVDKRMHYKLDRLEKKLNEIN